MAVSKKGRPKYKPANPLKEARRLVRLWYVDREENGRARFRAVGDKPVLVQAQARDKPWRTEYHSLDTEGEVIPLTARGTETRGKPSSRPLRQPLDVDAAGHFTISPELVFANRAMGVVALMSDDWFRALEMNAAGYPGADIGQEIGCSEPVALRYVDNGLTVVQTLAVVKPW